ncbi:HD domain-containing phosphohydrolase [Nitratidesulfovibrio sp. SRB-5]|uniref:HD domain-containing phosphohydrolase n=1 Tax=Nitratidesulfovibrio sp. SRB-5 TaxID=2872636 RepID=UPI0010269753|nr:HD domain-containing phosphohydrolase [Nitratidesulfovibrio sp. SRB-5]MBZ2172384.1 HD domain-containing protein [Nitratidesulfovibrio sp. SRB-5]RXF76994.1 HD domain-containing protein [Desulfovibrio sp. DS-1]
MAYCKILLVEDEAVSALDMRRRLRSLGYGEPMLATSGEQAVAAARNEKPDLVLMDIVLGEGMDGIDAAGRILGIHPVPVIYMTAHEDPETLQRAKITEPFGYLLKPFEDRDLRTSIEMALYKHQVDHETRRKERWFATTLRSIADAVLTVDRHGRITYINASAEAMTGADHHTCIDRHFAEHVDIRPGVHGHSLQDPNDLLAPPQPGGMGTSLSGAVPSVSMGATAPAAHAGPTAMTEAFVHGPDGRAHPIEMSASSLADPDGRRVGTVLVFRDITERRQSEAALRRSVEDLRRTLRQTVSALATASEKRDPYTAGHQARVAELAHAMAVRLGLSGERLEGLRVAGMLHDIGKIHIPAEILAKPTRLSDLEMGIMRTHSQVGYDILKEIEFPWPVAQIVLQHHERLDGTGYPNALSGDDVLPEARILAVADVVEAMSSHRPYRASLGLGPALAEIAAGRGTRYDRNVVDVCVSLFHDGFILS